MKENPRTSWVNLVRRRRELVQQTTDISKRMSGIRRDDPQRQALCDARDQIQAEISVLKEEIETRMYERQFAERIFVSFLEREKSKVAGKEELNALAARAWAAAEEFYAAADMAA